jgi:imidazolonepropionase-like amidohydrolase
VDRPGGSLRSTLVRGLAALAVAAAASAVGAATSTAPPLGIREHPPELLAFTGATLVVAPGEVIAGGTLVVREGRIVAVGAGVEPPAGALVRDLAGKRVYAGFLDPYTEYGLAGVGPLNPPEPSPGPRYEGRGVGAGSWNDAVHAARIWADAFTPDPEAAADLLADGVTAVESARLDGIFRGRGFVASLGEGRPEELLLKPVGLPFAAFDKGSSQQAYPSSLMGSIALVRQTLLDARWYVAARAAAAGEPAQQAPAPNRDLEALAGDAGPIVFASDDVLSLLRAGRISREMGVPFIHLGSNWEYTRLGDVAALGQPILLPVDYPEPPPVRTADDEVGVSLAELRHWERAPSNPAALARAGVPFAFTGWGRPPGGLLRGVRKAVRRGLSPDAALAALTTVPAGLLGVADEMGSLAVGKRADFVVADGDLLAGDGAQIDSVWVGGRLAYEGERVDFRGAYRLRFAGEDYDLELRGRGRWLSGELRRGDATAKVERVRQEARRVHFRVDLTPLGMAGRADFTLAAPEHGNGDLTGRASLPPDGRLVAVAVERTAPPAAAGEGVAAAEEGGGEGGEEEGALVSRLTYPPTAFGYETPPAPEDVLIRGATIWTSGPAGVIEGGDLLVRGGKVAAVGRGLAAPPGVRVIDGAGKHVAPGIIDEHSHLAISGGVNEGSDAVTSEVRIGDVVDPEDIGLYRALAGGVTIAHLLHGSANPIGGQCQIVKLRWGRGPEELKLAGAPPTIKFALGENVKQSNWGDEFTVRYPQTRMGVEALMRDSFVAARAWGEEQQGYAALPAAVRQRTAPPRRDLQLEALWEILNHQRFIHIHSYVQSEVLTMIRLAEEMGFTVGTFTHILEGYKVAPEIAAHGAGASTFSDWWDYKFEVYDAIPYNTCLLTRAGVVTSVNSDSDEMIRRLNQEAGKSVMYCGMEPAEALKLVTINPAIQLHVADRVGSLEPGKDADFAIWNGPPLSMFSRVEETWIDGARTFSLAEDARLRAADAAERQALVAKAFRAASASGGERGGGGAERRQGRGGRRVWHCDDREDFWRARDEP